MRNDPKKPSQVPEPLEDDVGTHDESDFNEDGTDEDLEEETDDETDLA